MPNKSSRIRPDDRLSRCKICFLRRGWSRDLWSFRWPFWHLVTLLYNIADISKLFSQEWPQFSIHSLMSRVVRSLEKNHWSSTLSSAGARGIHSGKVTSIDGDAWFGNWRDQRETLITNYVRAVAEGGGVGPMVHLYMYHRSARHYQRWSSYSYWYWFALFKQV
jgi:hypothetical protein